MYCLVVDEEKMLTNLPLLLLLLAGPSNSGAIAPGFVILERSSLDSISSQLSRSTTSFCTAFALSMSALPAATCLSDAVNQPRHYRGRDPRHFEEGILLPVRVDADGVNVTDGAGKLCCSKRPWSLPSICSCLILVTAPVLD
jgi:hypothetical protein